MHRRLFLTLALAGLASTTLAISTRRTDRPCPPICWESTGEPYFSDWINGFYPARARGGRSARSARSRTVGTILGSQDHGARRSAAGVRPSDQRLHRGHGQSEADRHRPGKARLHAPSSRSIERTYGVPRDILIAVWAMESNFGVHCRATSTSYAAWRPWRRRGGGGAWAEGELLAFSEDHWRRRRTEMESCAARGPAPWARRSSCPSTYLASGRRWGR